MKKMISVFLSIMSICLTMTSAGLAQESFEYPETIAVSNVQVQDNILSGEVQNTSDMPIRSAEITVFFMDENNEPAGQTEITLIQPGDGALLPGETRQFSLETDTPGQWSSETGSLTIRATELDFAPRKQRRQENVGQQNGGDRQQEQKRTRDPSQCPTQSNGTEEKQQSGDSSPAPGDTGPIVPEEPLPQEEPNPPLIEPGKDFPTAPGEEPQR